MSQEKFSVTKTKINNIPKKTPVYQHSAGITQITSLNEKAGYNTAACKTETNALRICHYAVTCTTAPSIIFF
jgi:hypothetical protein